MIRVTGLCKTFGGGDTPAGRAGETFGSLEETEAASWSGMYSRTSLMPQFNRVQRVSRVWVDTCMFFFRRPICPALK